MKKHINCNINAVLFLFNSLILKFTLNFLLLLVFKIIFAMKPVMSNDGTELQND